MTSSNLLQPGDVPFQLQDVDDPRQFPTDFASDTWPVLFQKLVHSYANAGARDAAISGLSSTERAFAFLEDSKTLWRWNGTAWVLAAPWTQTGTVTVGAVPAGGSIADITVTFPVAFTSAGYIPNLQRSFQAARVEFTVVSRSAASMQLRVENFTGSASSASATLYWSATLAP